MSLYILDFNQLKDIQPELIEGDTVLIKDGTYPDLSLTINNKALLNKRITIKSENFGKVILTGNCKINIIGNHITFGDFIFKDGGIKNSVEIKGLGNRITNCDFSFNNSDGPIIAIHSKNNRIDHCIFHDFTKAGVWVEVIRTSINDYVLIDHNIFRNRSLGIGNGFETIRIGTSGNSLSDSNSIIYNNLFENCDGELEAISNKSSGNIIYKNTLLNTKGTITLRHGNSSIVAKNKFLQNNIENTGGIRICGENHIIYNNLLKGVSSSSISINNGVVNSPLNGYLQVKNVNILNNYLVNNTCDYTIGLIKNGGNLKPTGKITENIVYKTNNEVVFSFNGTGGNILYTNNKYYATNFGNKPLNEGELSDPLNFNPLSIDESKFGYDELIGPQISISPEDSELKIEVNVYYDNMKKLILDEMNKIK
jgi:poly(beta-D-mannuronate) lyase